MKVPNAEKAIVPESKVRLYLLNPAHRVGASKAAFFLRFGFANAEWEMLAKALCRHVLDNDVSETEVTRFGTRYAVDGPLLAPDGTRLNVRSAWFIDAVKEFPRFVTAHPLARQ
jgi:hypothetical protein